MTREARQSYTLSSNNIAELNFILAQISNRLDELEGRRGTPRFKSNVDMGSNRITSVGNATGDNDALPKVQTTNLIDESAQKFESDPQEITSAGLLQIEHGLNDIPQIVQVWLECQTSEAGYSGGDVVLISDGMTAGTNVGVSITCDDTNINIRYGVATGVFNILHKVTGINTNLTNGNWKAIFRARV